MSSEHAFHQVPPEIWDKIVAPIGRRDLAALAQVSRHTYPHANPLLYRALEVSFCKCSLSYYDALARTLINCPELAALVTTLVIDMKVPCRVKTASSVEDFKATGQWKRHFRMPFLMLPGQMGHAEWNREAVQTLRKSQFLSTLPCLTSLKSVTVVLGHFEHDTEILSSLLKQIPESILQHIHYLKLSDASLTDTRSLRIACALRALDLGYVGIANQDLCVILSQNAGSLEELRLNWIMEISQNQLISGYSGAPLMRLKVFASQGPHSFSMDGLKDLFGEARALEELRLESLSAPSALAWSQMLIHLTGDDHRRAEHIRYVSFGAATGCVEFWSSVAHFLCQCGDRMQYLCINGSPRGPSGPFPSGLLDYFNAHEQPNLTSLILIWRDDTGLEPESALSTLETFCPSIELLHTCLRFPCEECVDDLLSVISPFTKLRTLHLTFLRRPAVTNLDEGTRVQILRETRTLEIASEDIAHKGPLFRAFIESAAAHHSALEEVSWSIYDRLTFSAEGPVAYVKIKRPELSLQLNQERTKSRYENVKASYDLEDLGEKFREHESPEFRYRCPIGSKKVLLNQKPSWREEMGNPFLVNRRVCQYADFGMGGPSRPRRRGEL
ncbi:hypothetical protein DFH11DRAFT_1562753 [Phellopilus nigrolimitatus]|nr:hypothetical protein DFH11DRAFT_1562753 [Phellopilus nigrolimitatus]